MMVFRHLRLDEASAEFLTLWIDVQDRRFNVLEEEFFHDMERIRKILIQAGNQKPVVIRSAKPKGFVVGADLRSILQIHSDAEIQAFLRCGQEALNRWELLPFPTIAWLEGTALGGGLELALACRYRVATLMPDTVFGMPETKLGLTPGWGGTQRLIPLVGWELGLQMLLLGESLDCENALACGLVDQLWPMDLSGDTWNTYGRDLIAQSRSIVRLHERVLSPTDEEELNTWKAAAGRVDEVDSHLRLPAREVIWRDVMAGLYGDFDAGLKAERTNFFELLNRDEVQDALRRFDKPKSPSS